ncbi:MAG TPA: hypothetical protein PKA53_01630 [Sphingobacterium sp.]|nr:hypothetical protein [Sphingobacterium sp.]
MREFFIENKTVILWSIAIGYYLWLVWSDWKTERDFRNGKQFKNERRKRKEKSKFDEGKDEFDDGLLSFHSENFEKALKHFDSAFSLGYAAGNKNNAIDFYIHRGFTLQRMEYDYDALDDFNKAIEHLPNDCSLYFARSTSKTAICDDMGALDDLKIALKLANEDNLYSRIFNEKVKAEGWESTAAMFDVYFLRAERRVILKNDIQIKIDAVETEKARLTAQLNGFDTIISKKRRKRY